MKKISFLQFMLAIMVMVSFALVSCTKEGPAGPAGKDGTNGTDGTDGTNGSDGTNGLDGGTNCAQCHDNTQTLFSKVNQWEHSFHATGEAFNRNTAACATCHTSQGFIGVRNGTYDPAAAGAKIENPNPPNCYTCHMIHDTYSPADWALRVTGEISMFNTTETYDFGKSSICASCHQGRAVSGGMPVPNGPDVTFTGVRYGVHHGPMANVFTGKGLFNIGDGLDLNSPHTTMITEACVTCHMASANGYNYGEHTMNVSGDVEGTETLNTAGCVSCHADAAALLVKVTNLQTEISGKLIELKALLDAKGITAAGSDNTIGGTYPANVAGACINYKAITEDKSLGVHNFTYVRRLLQNSIDGIQ